MTTSIRTKVGDVFLADTIGSYFYDEFKNRSDCDECMDAAKDFVVSYVNEHLPDRFTWFPSLSEVYVEIDPGADDIDDRELDDIMYDLVTDAIAQTDNMLGDDPDAFAEDQ